MGSRKGATALLLALAVIALATGCGSSEESQPRTLGTRSVYTGMPLSPGSDPAGRDIVDAERLALAEREGRAGDYRVRLVVRSTSDATGAPSLDQATLAAREAARSKLSLGFIGAYTSSESAEVAPILNRAGLLQVTPTSTASALTAVVPGTFRPVARIAPTGLRTLVRLAPSDAIQAKAVVAYMREETVERIVIADDGGLYGNGLASGVASDARKGGIRVVGRIGISSPSPAAAARRAASLKADALFVAANSSPATLEFMQRFARTDPEAKIFLPDGLSERPSLLALGDAQNRTYVTSFALPASYYGSRGVRFIDRFRDRYRRDPSPFALYGYEAMSLVLDAIADLPSGAGLNLQGQRRFVVNQALRATDRASVIGSYSITPTGDVSTDLYGAFRVEGGRLARGRGVTVESTR